jgi:NitT/TauT family transport system ATP-binding protein
MSDVVIEVENLSKTFTSIKGPDIEALRNVSFSVRKGEFLTIIGPSGCGKSTILNILAGLVRPTSGVVKIEGVAVDGPSPDKIAMMFQEYTLLPWRNVLQNVEFGLELRGLPKEERALRAKKYLRMMGLQGFENKYPHELSGGMKQRVALARSLSLETPLLSWMNPLVL